MRRTNEVLRQRRDKKGRKDGENREGQEVRTVKSPVGTGSDICSVNYI